MAKVKTVQFGSPLRRAEVESRRETQFHESLLAGNENKVADWVENHMAESPSKLTSKHYPAYGNLPSVEIVGVGNISTLSEDSTASVASREAIQKASRKAFAMPRFHHLEK